MFLAINENNIISIRDSDLFCKGLIYDYDCLNDLKTTDKTVVGAINELFDKKQYKVNWKKVDIKINDEQINYSFIINKQYKIGYTFGDNKNNDRAIMYKFLFDNEIPIIPPTPCSCPKWKDVAITVGGTSISYQLKPNTYYKIFYDLNHFSQSTMYKYPMKTIEIFWQLQTLSSYWVCFLPSLRRTSYINIANNNFIKLITDQGLFMKITRITGIRLCFLK